MTVIACKGGWIAADCGLWHNGVWMPCKTKLQRLADGGIAGGAGWQPEIEAAVEWLEAGADPKNRPPAPSEGDGVEIVILRPDRSIWILCGNFRYFRSEWPIAAAGAHDEFLLGAMLAGLSATEAVDLAIAHCAKARPPMTHMHIDDR